MTGTSEFEHKRTAKPYINKRVSGLLATPLIELDNHVTFAYLEPEVLNASSGIFSFPDLAKVTSSLEALSLDGVHFQGPWYAAMINNLVDVICAQ